MLKWLTRAALAKKAWDWYTGYRAERKARREEAQRNKRV